jgi:hypothetical protein
MSSNFDRDIKGVPVLKGVNEGNAGIRRFLTVSSSATTGTGIRSAKANTFGKQ